MGTDLQLANQNLEPTWTTPKLVRNRSYWIEE